MVGPRASDTGFGSGLPWPRPGVRKQPGSGASPLECGWKCRDRKTRPPELLLRLAGLFLLRLAARQLLALLFQEPPRWTRCDEPKPCLVVYLGLTDLGSTTVEIRWVFFMVGVKQIHAHQEIGVPG